MLLENRLKNKEVWDSSIYAIRKISVLDDSDIRCHILKLYERKLYNGPYIILEVWKKKVSAYFLPSDIL